MALYTVKDWGLQTNDYPFKDEKTGKTESRQVNKPLNISGNVTTFDGLTGLMGASFSSVTKMATDSNPLKFAIYSQGNGVYAFASTATAAAPDTSSGGWKLIASGTGTTGTEAWDASKGTDMKKMSFTLASGSNYTLEIKDLKDIQGLTASNGADSVLLNGTSIKSVSGFGADDKIYVLNNNALTNFAAASGLTLVSSADASTEGGVAVLKSGFSSSVGINGASDGSALTIALNKYGAAEAKIVSTSGKVTISQDKEANVTANVSVDSILGGTTSVKLGSGNDSFTGGTLTGGTLEFDASAGADVISIKEVAGTTVNFKTGVSDSYTVKIDTISSGKVTVNLAKNTVKTTGAITGGSEVFTGNTAKATLTASSGTLLKEASIEDNSKGLIFGGSGAMSVVASSAAGNVAFGGTAADLINIKSLNAATAVSIFAAGTVDTVSVGSFGAKATAEFGNANDRVTVSSGSNIQNLMVSADGNALKLAGGTSAVSLVGAAIKGDAAISGSSKDDLFEISRTTDATAGQGITLTGGSGNDAYFFASGVESVTVSDFGWSTSSEEALNAASGQDIIFLSDITPSSLGKIQYSNGVVTIGGAILTASTSENAVYAKIAQSGKAASTAKTYRINAGGAKEVGADSANTVTPVESADGSLTFDASEAEHAYINAGSKDATIENMTAYNGTNDRTASIIDTDLAVADMTQTVDSSGNVVLSGGADDPTITIKELGAGKAIKVGGKTADEQTAVVLGKASGNTAVDSGIGDEAIATAYIGASGVGSTFDFSNTAKTTIDLSGTNENDNKATYKDVKGIIGSDDGKSLLISGENAVTLQAAGKDDTLSGAGKGNDTLVSNSKAATNFLLSSGGGNDVVQGFNFGTDSTSDKVLIGNTGFDYSESIISASNGLVKVGGENGTLRIGASGKDTVAVQYNFGGEHSGTAIVDTSAAGTTLNFQSGANIILGQGEATTVKAGSGVDVVAKDETKPAGIGWNSDYIVANVGVVDASASDMTAVNGQKNAGDKVIAATGADITGPVWVCGGIGENFTDLGNDTLVASGQGNNEIFVGATMGNDVIEKVSSKDKITFVNTKVEDFGGIDNVLKLESNGNTFAAVFTNAAGVTTTIKGTTQLALDKTTNLTFHFDDADYVWDGKTLNESTATA